MCLIVVYVKAGCSQIQSQIVAFYCITIKAHGCVSVAKKAGWCTSVLFTVTTNSPFSILIANTPYSYSVPYIILLILPFMQGEVQIGYSKCAYSFINQILLALAWRRPGCVRQVPAATSCSDSYIVSYHALLFKVLLIYMHCNCMRTGFEVCACTASLPHVRKKNSFLELIRVKDFS